MKTTKRAPRNTIPLISKKIAVVLCLIFGISMISTTACANQKNSNISMAEDRYQASAMVDEVVRPNDPMSLGKNEMGEAYGDSDMNQAPPVAKADYYVEPNGMEGSGETIVPISTPAKDSRKIIFQVNTTLEVEDTPLAMDKIKQQTVALGGYISTTNYYQSESSSDVIHYSSYMVVKIPVDKMDGFLETAGTFGKVLSQDMTAEDITEQYVDIESRLKNAKAQEEAILKVLEQARKVDDILLVRQELSRIQQEVEVMEGQLRLMENHTSFSTISISLVNPRVLIVDPDDGIERWDFNYIGKSIRQGFKNSINSSVNFMGRLLIGLSNAFIPLLFLLIVILIIIFSIKRTVKKSSLKSSSKASLPVKTKEAHSEPEVKSILAKEDKPEDIREDITENTKKDTPKEE